MALQESECLVMYYKEYYKITKNNVEKCFFHENEKNIFLENDGWDSLKGYSENNAYKLISHWNRLGYPVLAFSLQELDRESLDAIQLELSDIDDYRDGKILSLFETKEIK